MKTRRRFIVNGLILLGAGITGVAARAGARAASSKPSAKPPAQPTPAPTPKPPSALARELARSLQHQFPAARLSDATTEKIAADIESFFDVGKAFRKRRLKNSDEPDCAFSAIGPSVP